MQLKYLRRSACALILLLPIIAWGQHNADEYRPLPPQVVRALNKVKIPLENVGVVVTAVDQTAPLLAVNQFESMSPASVMKVVTAYAALELLGPAFTWKTDVLLDQPWHNPADGVLDGNIYIRAGGDPKLMMEKFWIMLQEIQGHGIKHIKGNLVIDRSFFKGLAAEPPIDDQLFRPYNVPADAFLVNLQTVALFLHVKNNQVGVKLIPPNKYLDVTSNVTLSEAACERWQSRLRIQYANTAETANTTEAANATNTDQQGNGDGSAEIRQATELSPPTPAKLAVSGSFPRECASKAYYIAALSPNQQVDAMFRALWSQLGGTFSGKVLDGSVPSSAAPLLTFESPPLAEVVRDMNKFSINPIARNMFLSLGSPATAASSEELRAPNTLNLAVRHLKSWMEHKKLDVTGLVVENGSGLSRGERIRPQTLAALLQSAWNSPVMPELLSSLPIVGVDGTMQKRLSDNAATGRAHIKTGTLDGVKSIAGIVTDVSGRRWVVVMMVNDPRAGEAKAAMDLLLEWLINGRPE